MREQAKQAMRAKQDEWQRFGSSRKRSVRRRVVSAAAVVAVGAMAMGALAPTAASAATRPDRVQQVLNTLVGADGPPGALASVTDRDGRARTYTAGTGDLATGSKVPKDGQVRIGSNTKTFTAVVVLQLVAEGRIALDGKVDDYLPGLVHGAGIDGRLITVRHLLQQTSGLPNYSDYLGDEVRYFKPTELVRIALRHGSHFDPGTKWEYSNTNYVLAGLIVEKVTRHSLAHEMDQRVFKRIGLRHTYFPAPGDAAIRGPHPHGYYRGAAGAPLTDITEIDPSWGWAAGALISTTSELNRFYSALLDGRHRLLPEPQLAEMRRATLPADKTFGPGARYGLGLVSRPLPCGKDVLYWGHGGSFPGYETRGGATDDGRAANIAVTMQLDDEAARSRVDRVAETALCR